MSDKLCCASCGASIPGDSLFCPVCGCAVSEGTESGPVPPKSIDGSSTAEPSHSANVLPSEDPSGSPTADSSQEQLGRSEAHANLPTDTNVERTGGSAWDLHRAVTLVAGCVMVVAGCALALLAEGPLYETSFGGDAYTYIYGGIQSLSESISLFSRCLGATIAAFGALVASKALEKRYAD